MTAFYANTTQQQQNHNAPNALQSFLLTQILLAKNANKAITLPEHVPMLQAVRVLMSLTESQPVFHVMLHPSFSTTNQSKSVCVRQDFNCKSLPNFVSKFVAMVSQPTWNATMGTKLMATGVQISAQWKISLSAQAH